MQNSKYYPRGPTALLLLALSQLGSDYLVDDTTVRNGVVRKHMVWEKVQLTKAERKGKTYEEQQAMRKAKYEETKE